MKRTGYIILLRPDLDKMKYEAADYNKDNLHHIDRLRKVFNFLDPTNYRGTGRESFSSNPYYLDESGQTFSWPESDVKSFDSLQARQKLAEIEYTARPKDEFEDFYFYDLTELNSVFELIQEKDNYEGIQVLENEAETNSKTIGFDVGYWASDYSVIADTAIKPLWHPPDFNDIDDIVEHLKLLNENCLFPSVEQARNYRELYLTKDWGEKETYDGQITVIQVRKI